MCAGIVLFAAVCLFAGGPIGQAYAEDACSNYGINSHIPSAQDMEKIKAAGFDWIRVDFNWWVMEPSNNNWQWGQTDPVVNKAQELGLNIFATLSYTPQWAAADQNCVPNAGGDDGCNPKPFASVAEWQDFVSHVVGRYKGKISHWGMWNEPNLDGFYSGTEDQYVYDILIPGAQAAKGADPNALILGPELAGLSKSDHWNGDEGICLFGGCIFNGWEVSLANVLDKGGDHIDIITHHFYTDDEHEFAALILDGEYDFLIKTHDSLKEVVEAHGQGQPVWLTEWGFETHAYGGYEGGGGFSNQEQADYTVGCFDVRDQIQFGGYPGSDNDPFPQLEKLFYYDFHDGVFNNELWSFGIVDTGGNPKPVYNAIQQYFNANPPDCNDGPDPPPPGEAPTISGIPDVLLVQGKSKPHAVDLLTFSGDQDTPDAQLIFSVQNQNPGELKASIQDGRYLALIPEGNWTGSGTVTVQVSDGNKTDSDSVSVEVIAATKPMDINAPKMGGLVMDGSLGDWWEVPGYDLKPSDHWAGLQGETPSAGDFSGNLKVAWDDGSIYVAIEVTDDVHANQYDPDTMWMGDSVQVAIDSQNNKSGGYDGNDWEVGVAILDGVASTGCWHKPDGYGGCPVQVAANRVGDTTTYEMKIPGDYASTVGFSLLVNEDDGEGREGWLEWTPGIGFGKAPNLYGDVNLVDEYVPPVEQPVVPDTGGQPDVISQPDTSVPADVPNYADMPGVELGGNFDTPGGSEDTEDPWYIAPDTTGDATVGPGPGPGPGAEDDEVSSSASDGCSAGGAAPPASAWPLLGLLLALVLSTGARRSARRDN